MSSSLWCSSRAAVRNPADKRLGRLSQTEGNGRVIISTGADGPTADSDDPIEPTAALSSPCALYEFIFPKNRIQKFPGYFFFPDYFD